jgi:VanZ family protein
LLFGLWLALVAGIIVCADVGWLGLLFARINRLPLGDKAGHFFLIGMLAVLLNQALRGHTLGVGGWRLQTGGLIITALITLEEISQAWIPGRNLDAGDLLANYAGIACAEILTRRRPRQRME